MYIESREKIKKPTSEKKVEEKDKEETAKPKKKSKKKFLIILLSIILIAIIISIIAIYFLRKEKPKENSNILRPEQKALNYEEFQNKISEVKNNSIKAVYSLKKKEELNIFNPESINLSKDNYDIEILSLKDEDNNSDSSSNLRNLDEIEHKFISTFNGKIEIRINFFIQLISMLELFKGCRNLLEVDLSNLDGSKLKNANSVFENCDNLVFTNFNLKNGINIQSMDNSFSGCEKLKDVDLTDFKPQKNISIQNMFKNCAQLNYVDLSNFQTNNYQGIFVGAININQNININVDINTIKENLIQIINILKETKVECEKGEGSKCKSCLEGSADRYCGECNEGYYLPYNKKRTECIKCEDNCLECIGLITISYCVRCEEGYESINGKCVKECIIGEEEKCKSCDVNEKELCGTCNDGYYLPEDNKETCKECSMKCCKECPNDKCILCNGDDIKYPELTLEEALKKVQEEELAPLSFAKNIYYSNRYPMIEGLVVDGRYQVNGKKHLVFNSYKRKMIILDGLHYISSLESGLVILTGEKTGKLIRGSEYNNEYFQAVRQGYDFTCIDHIYQKNNKNYKYNTQTLIFNEINDDDLICDSGKECIIGPLEKCRACDIIQKELCGECNDGYYLPEDNKETCKKCSMKFCKKCPDDKCTLCDGDDIKDRELKICGGCDIIYESNIEKIYCSDLPKYFKPDILDEKIDTSKWKKYYVFNSYKRKMIELDGLYNTFLKDIYKLIVVNQGTVNKISWQEYNNEYFQAIIQGYEFTCADHLYQKNGNNFYLYNDITLTFEQIYN